MPVPYDLTGDPGVSYVLIDHLGYVGYRVGDDGSLWSKRVRTDKKFTNEVEAEIRRKKAAGIGMNALCREYQCSNSAIYSCLNPPKEWRKKKFSEGPNGYAVVGIQSSDGKNTEQWLVHRLILLAFVGPCPEGMEARHYPNKDRKDNRLCNLSWATKEVNEADKFEHGTITAGERNGMASTTEQEVREIRRLADSGMSATSIATMFGRNYEHVRTIIKRETWYHI
jgi:hypothetical protein